LSILREVEGGVFSAIRWRTERRALLVAAAYPCLQ